MIWDILKGVALTSLLGVFIGLILPTATLPAEVGSAIQSGIPIFLAMDMILPITSLITIFGIMLTAEMVWVVWKLTRFVLSFYIGGNSSN